MNNIDKRPNLSNVDSEGNPLLDENARSEAEKYLKKRMNWTPRNEDEEDLYEMGLQSLLENYI